MHLFATLLPRLDVAQLHCDSHFSQLGTGRQLPEMDGYGWFGFDRAPALVTSKMAAVLTQRVDLRQALGDLNARLRVPLAA